MKPFNQDCETDNNTTREAVLQSNAHSRVWTVTKMRTLQSQESAHEPRTQNYSGRLHESVTKTLERPAKPYAPAGASRASNGSPTEAVTGSDAHWNLALAGLLMYAFIEYSRLPEMFPIFKPFHLGKVAILVAALGYMLSPRIRASGRPASRTLDFAILVFILGALFSSFVADQYYRVWDGFVTILYWGIVYFAISRVLVSSWHIRIFLFLVLLLDLKFAQHTVREYLLGRLSGMSDMRIITSGGAGQGTSSFFGNVADLGLAMAVVWGIVWALLIGRAETRKLSRIFLMICFTMFFLAILLCGSRGAVVGGAAIVLAALARSPKKIGAVLLALIFVIGVWFVLPDASKQRFQNAWEGNDANASSRIMFWKIGLGFFEDNPVFGVGPGTFAEVNPTHFVSHSLYIQVLAESGFVGAISLAAILVFFFRLNARTRKLALKLGGAGRRSFQYCLAFGLDLGMVGYLASGAFLSVLYYPHLWILLGLCVAVNRCCVNVKTREQVFEKQSQGNFALVGS